MLLFVHNILVSFSTLNVSEYAQIIFLLFAALCFGTALYKIRYFDIGSLCMFGSLILLSAASYKSTGKMDMLYVLFLLFFLQYVRIDDFIMTDLIARSSLTAFLFFLSHTGLIENSTYPAEAVRVGSGFHNPNTFGIMIFLIFLDLIILDLHIWHMHSIMILFAYLISFLSVLAFSKTKTSLLILTAVLFGYMILKHKGPGKVRTKAVFLPVIPAAFSMIAIQAYKMGNPAAIILNRFLTSRLALIGRYLDLYPPTLLGNKVTYIQSSLAKRMRVQAVICDNIYAYLLCNLGILMFLMWMIFVACALSYAAQKKDKAGILSITALLIYGITENTMSNPMFFPVIIYAAAFLKMRKDERSYPEDAGRKGDTL